MSGQGAYITIANCADKEAYVYYEKIENMNKMPGDGEAGKGKPIGPIYVEASVESPSLFTMMIRVGKIAVPFGFNIADSKYWVDDGSASTKELGEADARVAIAQQGRGNQDMINVIIWPR